MTESGKVTRFSAPVISGKGEASNQEVIRVGTFAAVSDGRYLVFEEGKLKELGKQPESRFTGPIAAVEAATEGLRGPGAGPRGLVS